jgi:1-acyl-sn-glycerol-3-phosphate acyltransferase
MPRWLRIALTGWSFFLFFVGSPFLAVVVFPVMRLFARGAEDHRARVTRFVHRAMGVFWRWMELAGLVHGPRGVALPPGIDGARPYVMIANHPSLIDVILLIAQFERLTCVVKGALYRSPLAPLLRQTDYLPGPGSGQEESDDMLNAMLAHVERGHALLVFPEGTRSAAARLQRFRRGAIELAVRARVPLVCAYVELDRPFLMKGVPFWEVPRNTARYALEWLEVVRCDEGEHDARALQQRIASRYQERFARTLASRGEA